VVDNSEGSDSVRNIIGTVSERVDTGGENLNEGESGLGFCRANRKVSQVIRKKGKRERETNR